METSQVNLEGIKLEVARAMPSVSEAEFEWALSTVLDQAETSPQLTKLLIAAIDSLRDEDLRKTRPEYSAGSFIGLPEAGWQQVYGDSDRLARERLLVNSASMKELTELENQARLAADRAHAKEQELNQQFREFQGLPVKAEALQGKLKSLAARRVCLDENWLHDEIRQTCKLMLDGNPHARDGLTALVCDLETRETQLSILDEQQSALKADLAALESANKTLSKVLGRPRWSF